MRLVQNAGQKALRLEWPSRTDGRDVLQMQSQLQPGGWADVEKFSGTGDTLTKDRPAVGPTGFFRLQRELR